MNKRSRVTTFAIICSPLLTLIVGSNETIPANNTESPNKNINSTIKLEEGICDLINQGCQQFERIPNEYSDLRTRKCMCDEYCATYKDCCPDSTYYNESQSSDDEHFACSYTPYYGFIYITNKCPSNYSKQDIVYYCETSNTTTLVQDVALTVPVVNRARKIIYKNVFCAFCHDDTEVDFWNVTLHCELTPKSDVTISSNSSGIIDDKNKYSSATTPALDEILDNLKANRERAKLISELNGSAYECEVRANMSNDFSSSVRHCRTPMTTCNVCEKTNCSNVTAVAVADAKHVYLVDLTDPRLPKINHCEDSTLPTTDQRFEKYVGCVGTQPAPEQSDIVYCFYQKDGKDCLVNSNYALGSQFEYRANNTSVYVYALQAEFPSEEWGLNGDETVYVCGTFIPMSDERKFNENLLDVLTETLVKFSILFLLIFLIISANKKHLQSLPNKIIFSLCLTLLLLYAIFEIAQVLASCRVASVFIHFLYLSCFAWLLIASYDFWSVICRSSSKLQTLAGKTRLKRYIIYSFFGWISPIPVVAIAVYFDLADPKKIPCTWKPAYGRLGKCFISQRKAHSYFFAYPSSVIFCIIVIFFAHTSYHIYRSKRQNIKSTAQNNYYILFAKLAMTTGLTWTLGALVTFTDNVFVSLMYVLLNSSQGIFMFFAYGFKKTMLNKIYKMPTDSSVFQQTKSTFFSLTDRTKVRNLQPSQESVNT